MSFGYSTCDFIVWWRSLLDLVDALNAVHVDLLNVIQVQEKRYHSDISPQNILIHTMQDTMCDIKDIQTSLLEYDSSARSDGKGTLNDADSELKGCIFCRELEEMVLGGNIKREEGVNKSIILVGSGQAAIRIREALSLIEEYSSRGLEYHSIQRQIYGAILLDQQEPTSNIFQRKKQDRQASGILHRFRLNAFEFGRRMFRNLQPWTLQKQIAPTCSRIVQYRCAASELRQIRKRQCYSRILLSASQMACLAVVGNYKRTLKGDVRGDSMLWPCTHVDGRWQKGLICGSSLPQSFRHPSSTLFVFGILIYSICWMSLYKLNSRHPYQSRIIAFGILVGTAISAYLYTHNTALNVITTTMPLSLTVSSIVSGIIHSWVPSEEERVFRAVAKWAENLDSSENETGNDSSGKVEKGRGNIVV